MSSNLANFISMGIKAAGACLIGLPAWAQSTIERDFISQENAHWELIGSWQACVEVSDISLHPVDSSYIDDTLTVLREVVLNAESLDSLLNAAEQDIGALGLDPVSSERLIEKMREAKSISYSRSRSKMAQNLSAESSASFVIGDCAVFKIRLKERGRGILFRELHLEMKADLAPPSDNQPHCLSVGLALSSSYRVNNPMFRGRLLS